MRFTIILLLISLAGTASAQENSDSENFWGPSIEIGGSIGYMSLKNKPDWVAGNFRNGSANIALRLYRGLAVQGGYQGSLNENLSLKSLNYGNEVLENIEESYFGAPWAGLRYEIPSTLLKSNQFRIHSLYIACGYHWTRFGVTASDMPINAELETDQSITKYHVAEMSGPYGVVAARWRFDSEFSKQADSWLGSFGVDAGLKYSLYTAASPKYDTIEKPDPSFSSIQVFITGFIKISLFQ
ncbi:hypothetical protein ACFL60_03790 [Candidatus Omnitrophota bacterium]